MLLHSVALTCSRCETLTGVLTADNQLSGTIPPVVAPYLRDMIIANNELTGTVPSTIFSLPQAYRIDLVIHSLWLSSSCDTYLSFCSMFRIFAGW